MTLQVHRLASTGNVDEDAASVHKRGGSETSKSSAVDGGRWSDSESPSPSPTAGVDGNAETMPGMIVVGMSSARRPGTWWRSGLGWMWRLGLVLPLLFVAAVLTFFFGVAGTRFGWFNAPVILAGGGGLLTWLIFRGHPGRRPAALVVGTIGSCWRPVCGR